MDTQRMQFEEFAQLVSDALDNLYDQASLQTHPLGRELGIVPMPGETRAEALRRILHEAVESLRPPASVPQSQAEWLPYRVLSLHYLGSWPPSKVCDELSFSMSSFYRQRHKALEAVSSVLWNQRAPSSDEAPKAARQDIERPHERALRDLAALPYEPVSLPALIEGVARTLSPLAHRRKVELRLHCPDSGPTACVASDALRQILLGMLADCISTLKDDVLPVQLLCQGQSLLCKVMVRDAPACLTRVVSGASDESFWRSLVKVCDGRVWITDSAGGRAVLGVSIPLPTPAASVLVVEDDADAIALYRRQLEPAGYLVHVAHNETEVRQVLARITPDMILLDIILPQRDGWTVLSELSADARAKGIPIIVCSVAAHAPLARSLGAADVLQKPITREHLLRTLERCLNQGGTEEKGDPAGPADSQRPRQRP